MSKKAILDLTSRKKRDTMAPYYQTNGSTPLVGLGGYTASGNGGGAQPYTGLLWLATARDITIGTGAGTVATINDSSARTATSCYMRGLNENIEISTSSGAPWQWRRICFTHRDASVLLGVNNPLIPYLETNNGFQRYMTNFTANDAGSVSTHGAITRLIFKGTQNVDWNDIRTAPLDNTRIDVKYDKTTIISSGNANGRVKMFKRWHPMNKTLVYDDEENGEREDSNVFSVGDKRGMGDYYVIDFLQAGMGAGTGDSLNFSPTSTLYWHER